MQEDRRAGPPAGAGPDWHLKEVVMGLHWDPPEKGTASPADLDALCILHDAQDQILDVVHPGHTRAAGACVIHTGDSRDGAGLWDDERIFVFLHALPTNVAKLSFVVASATDRPLHEVRGAFCHISDRLSEEERYRFDLCSLTGLFGHTVAVLERARGRWHMVTDLPGA